MAKTGGYCPASANADDLKADSIGGLFHFGVDRRRMSAPGPQPWWPNPSPQNDGVMVLALLALFFAGMTLGGFLFAYKSEPMKIASNAATPGILLPNGAPPMTPH
jgi:hypothetical protein